MLLLSLIALLLGLLCLYPLVRRHILPPPESSWIVLLVAFALSVGGLTLWMCFVGILPGRWLTLWTALLFPTLMWGLGLWLSRGVVPRLTTGVVLRVRSSFLALVSTTDDDRWSRWLRLAVILSLAVTLVHSLYFPFVGDDELSRYAYYAQRIFRENRIAPDVRGYPMLLSLGYAWAFFVNEGLPGGEHLAKIVSWAFAPALVGATYWLASLWGGKRSGLIAAFTLSVTRLFADWSPLGYVDIPTGVYFALTGVFLTLWLRRNELRFAVVAGAMLGLALWTKQAGFAVLPSAGLIFVVVMIRKALPPPREAARHALAAFGIAALIGLPWYARNVLLGGWSNAVPGPGTFYYAQAQPTLLNWIPFIPFARDFGFGVAPLYLPGFIGAIAAALIRNQQSAISHQPSPVPAAFLFQFAFILPYLSLWWGWFSYDARFLLTILPFYAVLAGLSFEWVAARLGPVRFPKPDRSLAVVAALLSTVLLASGVSTRLTGVYRTITQPFASYDERVMMLKPDVYSVARFIRANIPPGARIMSHDVRLAYYLPDYTVDSGYPASLDDLAGYDYFVFGSWSLNDVYPRLGAADNELVRSLEDPAVFEFLFQGENGTINVYRLVHPIQPQSGRFCQFCR